MKIKLLINIIYIPPGKYNIFEMILYQETCQHKQQDEFILVGDISSGSSSHYPKMSALNDERSYQLSYPAYIVLCGW